MKHITVIAILMLLGIGCFIQPANGQTAPDSGQPTPDSGSQAVVTIAHDPPITIRADEIEADQNSRRSVFIGHVRLERGLETITADRVLWDDATNTAEISGTVKIVTPDFTALAERAVMNMDLQIAKIYDGRAFFPARNYYISGALMERQGEETITIKDGLVTTCDGPEPPWTIQANNLTVTKGGYATASGVSLQTKYFPAFYAPYLLFPVKNERQTGFLLPSVGNSSRDGFKASLPFFWATGENHDLTFIPVWREERGLSTTLEGRYHLEYGKGIWQGTYLKDHKPQIFQYFNSGEFETTNERYWLRAQNNWQVNGWDLNLDVDLVSDPLYLREFYHDLDGFYESKNLFYNEFGRTLNEYLDPVRTNTFFAQKNSYDMYFRGTLEYNDNPYNKNNVDTMHRLPSLQYNLVARPLNQLPGFSALSASSSPRLSFDMRYDYFHRKTNQSSPTSETGHRVYISPSLDWNTSVGDLINLDVNGAFDLTLYAPDGYRPYSGGSNTLSAYHGNSEHRFEGSLEAAASSTFSRVYEGGPGEAVGIRHQMSPTVSFKYVETPDQSDLPFWDLLDRRLSRRTIRYGLLNTLVSKTPIKDSDNQIVDYSYFQFLKVGLWSSYEFNDNSLWESDQRARYYASDYFDRGAGPIELEVEAYFNKFLSARLLSGVDGRTGDFTKHDLSLRLQDPRGDRLTLTYDYNSPSKAPGSANYQTSEEIRGDLFVAINDEWGATFSTRYDLQKNQHLESYARLRYQAQCYGLSLIYSKTYDDDSIGVVVDLLGLGSIGNSSPSLTNQ